VETLKDVPSENDMDGLKKGRVNFSRKTSQGRVLGSSHEWLRTLATRNYSTVCPLLYVL
jgi:hypothetical protein